MMGKVTFYSEAGWNYLKNPKAVQLCKKRRYQVQIQRGDSNKVYNVPDRPGMVYNHLEDSYEQVLDGMYVITGLLGEMYPVTREVLANYEVEPEDLKDIPVLIWTKPGVEQFEAVRIPVEIPFEVEIPEIGILYGNSPKSSHGEGDYLLRSVGSEDFRIVNGTLFHRIYEIL